MQNHGMRQTELHLTEPERRALNAFRRKGVHAAREVNRAHVLMALDQGVAETTICQVLGLGRTALWRTRAAYCQGGSEYAMHDEPRPGRPRKYQTSQEAEVVALACSAPPGASALLRNDPDLLAKSDPPVVRDDGT